jgi:hypothetical protein
MDALWEEAGARRLATRQLDLATRTVSTVRGPL